MGTAKTTSWEKTRGEARAGAFFVWKAGDLTKAKRAARAEFARQISNVPLEKRSRSVYNRAFELAHKEAQRRIGGFRTETSAGEEREDYDPTRFQSDPRDGYATRAEKGGARRE